MQTATIYTLNAKVVPVRPLDSTVRLYWIDGPDQTFYVENGEPVRIPESETIDLPLHRVSSFSRIEPPEHLMAPGNNTRNTRDHLFAVEPALKEILSAPFRAEWEAKVSKLEKENLAYNNKNYELEEKLKAAESKISHLKRHIESMEKTMRGSHYVKVWNQVWRFYREPTWKRLWIAFRNSLTP